MAMWHYVQGDQRMGPVSEDTLRAKFQQGELPRKTLVWTDGMTDWESAELVDAFRFGASAATGAVRGHGGYVGAVEAEPAAFYGYAGFWKRFAALILDSIITSIATFVIMIPVVIILIAGGEEALRSLENPIINLMFNLFSTVAGFLYYALFEGSRFQATPGKLALGIKVTDLDGRPIGFWHAFGRNLAKILSSLTFFLFFVGYWMAGITAKKQALHDMVSGCLVVNSR